MVMGEEGESMYGGKNLYKDKLNIDIKLFNLKLNNKPITNFLNKKNIKDYNWSTISKKDYNECNSILKCHWSFFENGTKVNILK